MSPVRFLPHQPQSTMVSDDDTSSSTSASSSDDVPPMPTVPWELPDTEFFRAVRDSPWSKELKTFCRGTRNPEGPSGEARWTLIWFEIVRFMFPKFSVVPRRYRPKKAKSNARDQEVSFSLISAHPIAPSNTSISLLIDRLGRNICAGSWGR